MKSQVSAQPAADAVPTMRCLAVPLQGVFLLVPQTMIAEVAPFKTPEQAAGPDWMLGRMDWRGVKVPLLSFERLLDLPEGAQTRQTRVIVFNGRSHSAVPFIAVVSQGIPRPMMVTEKDFADLGYSTGDYVLASFDLDGARIVVPDLQRIEILLQH